MYKEDIQNLHHMLPFGNVMGECMQYFVTDLILSSAFPSDPPGAHQHQKSPRGDLIFLASATFLRQISQTSKVTAKNKLS